MDGGTMNSSRRICLGEFGNGEDGCVVLLAVPADARPRSLCGDSRHRYGIATSRCPVLPELDQRRRLRIVDQDRIRIEVEVLGVPAC